MPEDCTTKLVADTQAIKVLYKKCVLTCAYMSVNDKEIHLSDGSKVMKINGNPEGCARRFLKTIIEPRILLAKEQERKEEEARIAKANKVNNFRSSVSPDEKDKYRAETAWARSNGSLSKYVRFLDQQLNKITDPNKARRRIEAFYDYLMAGVSDTSDPDIKRTLERLENRMLDRMTESRIGRRSLIESLTCELGDDDIEAIVREFDDSEEPVTFKDVSEFIKDLPLFAIQYTESDGDEEILDALDAEVKELANTVIHELKMCRG